MEIKQISQMKIASLQVAQSRLLRELTLRGYKIDSILPINNFRYTLVKGTENIMIMFKKEPFFNFGLQFRHLGHTGVGDTINTEDLTKALEMGVERIYTIFPNGIAYDISMYDFLKKCVCWTNKEGKSVKSISIHEYRRAFKL